MKTRIILIAFVLVLAPIIGVLQDSFHFANAVYCATTVKHDLKMVVERIATMALSNQDRIVMKVNFTQDDNERLYQTSKEAIDTSKSLNYTFTTGEGEHYKITVEGTGGMAPAGTALFVEANIQNGASKQTGTSAGEVMVLSDSTSSGGDLISNIGSCFTGDHGVMLKYRYAIIDPDLVDVNEGTCCTITYTIVSDL